MISNGIPLWFQCFKGKHDPEAFKTSLIIEGVSYVYDLFKDKDCNIIFLGDRFFSNCELMKYINSINATYCIRAKSNLSIYIYNYDKMAGSLSEVTAKSFEDQFFNKVLVTKNKYETNLAVSKLENHKEAFYILTNGKCEEAIKNYSYRFSSIEFVFKNQKSNGFYLESTKMRNLRAFTTLFGLMCVSLLWLTLLGVEYSVKGAKSTVKIRCYKKKDKKIERIYSLFNTGLIFFNLCFNSDRAPRIQCKFVLYEI